ncbi:heterokaryon incompatibility protein-domain-containing protein, partial [Cladorrhinum sp. PSN259]
MTTTSQFKKQWYFSYDPLDRSYDSFRLLTIQPGKYSAPLQCTLSHERISSVQDGYSALSYTWGTRATERWIRLNGIPFMVQPSLFEALKGIRKEDEQIQIWADGICINQSDTKERNHQVGLMGKIYSGAKNVRVWLGPAADDSDFVLEYVERAEAQFQKEKAGEKLDDDPKPGEEEEKAFLEAFRALHRRPYWGRAWIKQEVILAKELIIHCGTK